MSKNKALIGVLVLLAVLVVIVLLALCWKQVIEISDALSFISIIVSALSFFISFRADKRAERADKRAELAEKRANTGNVIEINEAKRLVHDYIKDCCYAFFNIAILKKTDQSLPNFPDFEKQLDLLHLSEVIKDYGFKLCKEIHKTAQEAKKAENKVNYLTGKIDKFVNIKSSSYNKKSSKDSSKDSKESKVLEPKLEKAVQNILKTLAE